ncbi:MAG: hypothetical protein SGJ18_00485 [Pseudomonadota bacterium]|nr:hypothetical protein [Pseudomonadota bacterium]
MKLKLIMAILIPLNIWCDISMAQGKSLLKEVAQSEEYTPQEKKVINEILSARDKNAFGEKVIYRRVLDVPSSNNADWPKLLEGLISLMKTVKNSEDRENLLEGLKQIGATIKWANGQMNAHDRAQNGRDKSGYLRNSSPAARSQLEFLYKAHFGNPDRFLHFNPKCSGSFYAI